MSLLTVEDRTPTADASAGRSVRVITMTRPEARNAMNTAMLTRLVDVLDEAARDDGVGAVVLTGAAGHFSGGADLKEQLDRAGQTRRMELFGLVYEAVATFPKGMVAAIAGSCVGGGAEVAAACDIRLADPTARFRFPGASLGIPVGAAKLVGLVGLGSAKDLVLTSRMIDVTEAHRLGLIQRIAEADPDAAEEAPGSRVLDAAVDVASAIVANNPQAVSYLKSMFDKFSGIGDRVAAENDALYHLAEAGGDYTALTAPNPKTTSGWSAVAWKHR